MGLCYTIYCSFCCHKISDFLCNAGLFQQSCVNCITSSLHHLAFSCIRNQRTFSPHRNSFSCLRIADNSSCNLFIEIVLGCLPFPPSISSLSSSGPFPLCPSSTCMASRVLFMCVPCVFFYLHHIRVLFLRQVPPSSSLPSPSPPSIRDFYFSSSLFLSILFSPCTIASFLHVRSLLPVQLERVMLLSASKLPLCCIFLMTANVNLQEHGYCCSFLFREENSKGIKFEGTCVYL